MQNVTFENALKKKRENIKRKHGVGGGKGCTKVFNSNVVKKITLSPNTCTLLDTSLQGFNLFFNTHENYSLKSNIILFECCSSGKHFGLEFYQSLFRVPLTSYFGISQFIITWPSLSNKKICKNFMFL